MKSKEPRVTVTLTLPRSTKLKAQQLATTIGVTLSHLIEGLIEGATVAAGGVKNEAN